MEDLGGVEGEHAGITKPGGPGNAEGVGGVVDDLQAMAVCDFLDGLMVAEVAVDMDRQDGRGLIGDERFDFLGVQGVEGVLDVAEDGLQALSCDGVGGGGEGEGGGDDLALKLHRLQHTLQGQVAVGVQGHVGAAQIVPKPGLEFLMDGTHVGQPPALPQGRDLGHVFLHRGEKGTGHIDHRISSIPASSRRQPQELWFQGILLV